MQTNYFIWCSIKTEQLVPTWGGKQAKRTRPRNGTIQTEFIKYIVNKTQIQCILRAI